MMPVFDNPHDALRYHVSGAIERGEGEVICAILTEDAIMHDARVQLGEEVSTVLEACEAFYGHGFPDEATGDVDGLGHFYRVHRWIVTTDSQGFHHLATFEDEATARSTFAEIEREVETFYDDFDNGEG